VAVARRAPRPRRKRTHLAIGVDIGGSGIKAALVDTRLGEFVSERRRVKTPASLKPEPVLDAVVELLRGFGPRDVPVGVGFPAVVVRGRPLTGFTARQVRSWIGFPVAGTLARRLRRPVTLLNDADAAGIAEMRFGRGRGRRGTVLVLTLGTGIGSALFVDGRLVPNTELGNLYLRGQTQVAERHAAAEVRTREGLGWAAYARRLDAYLKHVEQLFCPQLILVGGGVSRKAGSFLPRLTLTTRIEPARLQNRAGIVGAAVAAVEAQATGQRA
jgi:polyphosphate glucokinase